MAAPPHGTAGRAAQPAACGMNFLRKSLLLQWMLAQCQRESGRDWLALQRRDHDWFRARNHPASRWRLLADWLREFGSPSPPSLQGLPALLAFAGFFLGASLMAGLVAIQPLQRINLWWWLLFAVVLPLLTWLIGIWLGLRPVEHRLGWAWLLSRLPDDWRPAINRPLLALTFNSLLQHFSLWFGIGLLTSFLAYLALTDLAFGWASTLDVTEQQVLRLAQWLAWPWHALWPEAVPDANLVHNSRFWHERPLAASPDLPGQWWRFLLMCLLSYNLLPRLLGYTWLRLKLAHAQWQLFRQDPCLAGWWQRLHLQLAERRTEQPPESPPRPPPTTPELVQGLPPIDRVLYWNGWQEHWLEQARRQLPDTLARLPWQAAGQWQPRQGQSVLLLCQEWEPPTGALADFCETLRTQGVTGYLWTMRLPGMAEERAELLHRSWALFLPQLPRNCHLLELHDDAR